VDWDRAQQLIESTLRGGLGTHFETRRKPKFDRVSAQKLVGNTVDGPNRCQFQSISPLMGCDRVALRTTQELRLDSSFEFCGRFFGKGRCKNSRRVQTRDYSG
jgi:hypothetical protein